MLMVSGAMQAWIDLRTSRFASRPILEAPTVVPSLHDVAVVGQTVQQRAGHLGVHKDTRPFTKGEIGRHDDGGALIELADQIKQQLTTGLGEGEIAEFVEHDEVFPDEIFRDPSLPSASRFGLEPIDEIDGVVKAAAFAGANAIASDSDGRMCLSGAGRSSDILPGIRTSREESTIGSIRALVRWPFLCGIIAFRAPRSLSSSRAMALWRTYLPG